MLKACKSKSRLQTQQIDGHPIIHFYLDKLRLHDMLEKYLSSGREQKLSIGKTIQLMIHNILTSPGPLYRMREWAEPIAAKALGLTEDGKNVINDDRIGHALDALSEYGGKGLFFQFALKLIKVFNLKTERIHQDTTTCTFFGDYKSSFSGGYLPHITNGHNKDHRPDKKQLVFGVSVTNDGAVPIWHQVYSGNQTDDTLHIENFNNISKILQRTDFTYVADSKLCTQNNLAHLDRYGARFVTVLPKTRSEDQRFRDKLRDYPHSVKWYKILSLPNKRREADGPDIYYSCKGEYVSDDGFRMIWVKSTQKQRIDFEKRQKAIRTSLNELNHLNGKLNKRKLKKKKAIRETYNKILRTYGTINFIDVEIGAERLVRQVYASSGRPRKNKQKKLKTSTLYFLKVTLKKAAIKRESHVDGVFPLMTNHKKKSKVSILEIYKYQPFIEKRFALIKTEFALAPVYLKKPCRTVAMMDVYYFAMVVASLMERDIRSKMSTAKIKELAVLPEGRTSKTPTAPRILDRFANFQYAILMKNRKEELFLPSLNKEQKLILKLLGIPLRMFEEIYN